MDNKNDIEIDQEKYVSEMNGNLKNIFCIGLAKKTGLRKEIDSIFNKNKEEYLMSYKNSKLYKTLVTQSLDYETELYTEKVIGILEYSIQKNDYKKILDLFKKAYRKIYNNVKDLTKITLLNLQNFLSDGVETNYEYLSCIYVFYFIEDRMELTFLELVVINKLIVDMNMINIYLDTNYSDNIINAFKKELIELRNTLGIKKKMYTLESLITDILDKDMNSYNNKITTVELVDMDSIQKVGNVGKYVGAVEGLFKFMQIDTNILAPKISFTQKEIDRVLLNYIFSEKFNHFSEKDIPCFVILCFYFYALSKEYKRLKKAYIFDVNEEHLLEVAKLQKELNEDKIQYEKLTNDYLLKENTLIDKEKKLLEEINELKKKNQRLEQQLSEYNDLKTEVVKLRNVIFDNNSLEDIDTTIEEEEIDIDKLNALKVVVIGGNINWIKKMMNVFPNWVYVGEEQLNSKLDWLKNYNHIFINIKLKHSLYYKVIEILKKNHLKYDFIIKTHNINLVIKYINDKLLND